MSLVFKTIQTEGIAELSYLLGDDDEGIAAVFDPRPDCDVYVDMAREAGLAITHIFETHIHADLVSGSRELSARVESARIFASNEGDAKYGFEHEKVNDGDRFTFGELLVIARHTPGHTPEHMSYLLAEADHPDDSWGILTGDSLFVSSAGRPDLLGEKHTKQLAEQQFRTLRDFYLKMPDHVMIYPNHGAGSPCGADIGDRLSSTIGYERRFNKFLQFDEVQKFTEYALATAPPVPKYYPVMKKMNAQGPQVLGNLPRVPGLPPKAFKEAIEKKSGVLVDVRTMLAFGGGHIPGALNIGGSPILSIWAGWMLDPDELILADSAGARKRKRSRGDCAAVYSHWLHEVRRLSRRRNESVGCSRTSTRRSGADECARIEQARPRPADCRCSLAARMEKRTRCGRAPHFPAGTAQTHWRTRSLEDNGRLLRQRLSRQYCHQHYETRGL